jgi:hypothetical protein
MKVCPKCGNKSVDEDIYCPDDGTTLEILATPFSSDIPTQVVSTPKQTATTPDGGSSRYVYIAVGAMSAIIIVLSAAMLYRSESTSKETLQSPRTEITAGPKVDSPSPSFNTPTSDETMRPKPPPSEDSARALIANWAGAQSSRNFAAYKSCYSPTFMGIKRTPNGGREQLGYSAWMADRSAMMRNLVEVQVDRVNIAFDGDAAEAKFIQHFRSINHCDVGEKTIRIRLFNDGPKIVFEELRNPITCG